jgi:hypothetical protein
MQLRGLSLPQELWGVDFDNWPYEDAAEIREVQIG